jgi:uncharacterized protein (DUF2252 family)
MIRPTSTLSERLQFGHTLRRRLKRSAQAHWDGNKRSHDPIDIILEFNRERIPELVPIKMARMAASPFCYFRGNVPVMAADMALLATTGIVVQICGDAHVRNLGAYAAPDGRLVFDINDFDETIRGPWEWDLRRLATSLILAGREAGESDRSARDAVLLCAAVYRRKILEFSSMTCLEVHKYRIHRQFAGQPGKSVLERAERATPAHTLEKLTLRRGRSRIFKDAKPVLVHPQKSIARQVLASIKSYRETLPEASRQVLSFYRPMDVIFKIVGTGSVATHDYVVLWLAGDDARDPLFLQFKEAALSAYARYLRSSDTNRHQGQRIVEGQKMMQVQSDFLLGWTSIGGRDYMVRQLSDHKASIENQDLRGAGLIDYAMTCGEVLAKGHARSGDPAVLAGYLGRGERWDQALEAFAWRYAEQTTMDYESFKRAIRSGRIKAGKPYL